MTSFLCMIITEGIYRGKYTPAVKGAMAHIPSIDDIIEITMNVKYLLSSHHSSALLQKFY